MQQALNAIASLFPGLDEAALAVKLMELLPVFEAAIRLYQSIKADSNRATALNEITRGLHYASQTGDTALLENAIRAHCNSAGCRIP